MKPTLCMSDLHISICLYKSIGAYTVTNMDKPVEWFVALLHFCKESVPGDATLSVPVNHDYELHDPK